MSNDSVYTDLRDAIARGELEPNTSLIESDIMARYGAGRPAVRIAIVRLEQDGLVERVKNKTARVRLIPPNEAVEIYQARILLETFASAEAAAHITPSQVTELSALLDAVDVSREAGRMSEAVAGDAQFHQRILDIAGNATVTRLFGSLHGHLVLYHHRTRLEQESSNLSPAEHREILAALASGAPTAAARAMTVHLERLTDVMRSLIVS